MARIFEKSDPKTFLDNIRSQNVSIDGIPDYYLIYWLKSGKFDGLTNTSDNYLTYSLKAEELWYDENYNRLYVFTDVAKNEIILFSIILVFSVIFNVSGLVSLVKEQNRSKRINKLLIHLTIADLIVTLFTMPLEIGWRFTRTWSTGDFGCKFLQTLRIFGPYLSSSILVCIALDRYFALVHPLLFQYAERRTKIMLIFAWIFSFSMSSFQAAMFKVVSHPVVHQYKQCISFNTSNSEWQNLCYIVFTLIILYFLPLIIILICYSAIWWTISFASTRFVNRRRVIEGETTFSECVTTSYSLSNASNGFMTNTDRQLRRRHKTAQIKTTRMVVIIIIGFFVSWTPYVFITLWYVIDEESASRVDPWIQEAFFAFAVANTCINPFVYSFDMITESWGSVFTKTIK